MAYCELDDLKKHLQESDLVVLTDDAGAGVIDEDVTDEAIATADELIDAYLRGRYAVPLNPVPGLIKRISVDLAIFALYERKKFLMVPDQLVRNHDRQLSLLEKLQRGVVLLGIEAESEEPSSYDVQTNKTSTDRIFSSDLFDLML